MIRRALRTLREIDPIAIVAIFVLVLGAGQLVAGALSTGVTIDEPIEVEETQSWIDDGWYLPGYLLVDGKPDPNNELASPYVYGPAFGATAHLANLVLGNEPSGEISGSAASYDVRHLLTALLAAIAVGAVGLAVWRLTGSLRFALWAAAGLLAVPAWTGHGFFNPKDIPAGCGYTLVTVALLLALAETTRARPPAWRRLGIAALLAGGTFIGAGTRLTLLVPLLLSLLVYAALRLAQRQLGKVDTGRNVDVAVAAGAIVGFASIAAIYPKAASSPFSLLTKSVSGSSGYPWHGFTLTAGRLLSEHPPWYYLPAWIGGSYPVLLGALAVLGALAGVRSLLRARGRAWRGALWRRPDLGLVLVLQQALLLPVGAVVIGAVMYDGIRQHLYVLPTIAILAGVGAHRFWTWAGARERSSGWRTAAAALLLAALLVPTVEQTVLFPYNYAYVNPIAGIGGVNGRWETDYWFASGPEAGSHVPSGVEAGCLLEYPSWPCDEDQQAEIAEQQGTDVEPRWRNARSGSWLILRRHNANAPPEGCREADDVTRWLRGEEVIMSYVLRCR
jgi:hypothetical protein